HLGLGRHVAAVRLDQVREHAQAVATLRGRLAERRHGPLGRRRMSVAAPVVVIANPSAGRGKAGRRVGKIGDQLQRAGGDHAIRAIAAATTVQIDVARFNAGPTRRHYVAIAGCGFDSEVNETANAMRVNLGATGTYVAALVKTLSRFSPAGFRIELDDEVVEG